MISSRETLEECIRIFPEFEAYWAGDGSIVHEDGTFTICGVFMSLVFFMERHAEPFSEHQWQQLAAMAKRYFDMGDPIRSSDLGACLIESLEGEKFGPLVLKYFDPKVLSHFHYWAG